jgi:hypothetical protein
MLSCHADFASSQISGNADKGEEREERPEIIPPSKLPDIPPELPRDKLTTLGLVPVSRASPLSFLVAV